MRGYVFLERTRDVDSQFFGLEEFLIEREKKQKSVADDRLRMKGVIAKEHKQKAADNRYGIKAAFSLWGQYDAMVIIESDDKSGVSGFETYLRTLCQKPEFDQPNQTIADTTTMLAVNPETMEFGFRPTAILAIDTVAGMEHQVCDLFRAHSKENGARSPVHSCDVVLGEHDVIVVIKQGVGLRDYILFLKGQVSRYKGIIKTRTMITINVKDLKG